MTNRFVKRETYVYATVHIEGIHYWPDCDLDEVDYLQHPHRHTFVIKAYLPVNHDNRDVEFIMLQHRIRNYLRVNYYDHKYRLCNFENRSCEMIGQELINQFGLSCVDVSEDGENGTVIYQTELGG